MKNSLLLMILIFSLLVVSLTMTGCSKPYMELDEESFSQLKVFGVKEVDVVSTLPGREKLNEPDKWRRIYRNVFPISDSEKIRTIFRRINEGKPIVYSADKKIHDRKILFRAKKAIYFVGIGWDDKLAYGDWWESPGLLEDFKSWGLRLPEGKDVTPSKVLKVWTEVPYERDPNM